MIWILGQTLAPFDEDNLIPAYGFGDSQTTDEGVFSFTGDDDIPCHGFQQVLDRYNDTVKGERENVLWMWCKRVNLCTLIIVVIIKRCNVST